MSSAVEKGVAMGMFKKAASMKNANNTSSAPTQVNNQIKEKKQKRRVRPRNLRMRGGPGQRSMFGNQENQDANR